MIEALNTFNTYMYMIIIAFVILFGGFILGNLVRKLLFKILKEINANQLAVKLNSDADWATILSALSAYLVYIFAIILFLDYLKLRLIVIILLIAGILILISLSLLVGIRDVIPNLSGWLKIRKKLKIGKKIEVNGISGIVQSRGLFNTKVKTPAGEELYFPNQLFSKYSYTIKN